MKRKQNGDTIGLTDVLKVIDVFSKGRVDVKSLGGTWDVYSSGVGRGYDFVFFKEKCYKIRELVSWQQVR